VLQLEIPIATVYHTLHLARAHGIRTILNPALARRSTWRGGQRRLRDSNETEAEALSGMPVRTLEDARNCAQKLLDGGLRRVIVTLGANGALCAGADGSRHIPPYKVNPVDTTGRGRVHREPGVLSGSGCAEAEAIARASLYAALSTLAVGTQKSFVGRERLRRNGGN